MAANPRADVLRMNFDPALTDLALAEARDDLAQGNWESARDLLSSTTRDPGNTNAPAWDRRSHRIRVLAEAVANSAWVERWQVLDPVNPDAALLRAQVETIRVLRGATDTAQVEEASSRCRHAAEMAPEDPTPWVIQLTLARASQRGGTHQGRDAFWHTWQQLRHRDPFNRDGHHEALTYLHPNWCGSLSDMYDFAYWLAGEAPAGSPLEVLPLVAHAEAYRVSTIGTPAYAQPSPHAHWSMPQVVADVDRVLRSWLGSATMSHAQADVDRNYLLHAMVFAGRGDSGEARDLFDAIGSHAMWVPWSYTGDPESSFLYWRERAFAAGSPRR